VAEALVVDAPYAKLEQLEPGIARVLAHNPSAFTYYGTQTYLVGEREVAVIDPGPDLPEHLDVLERAIAGRPVVAIMCTHTHRDHSPAARPVAEVTGAPVVGCAPLALETVGPRADASFDGDYSPDRILGDGDMAAYMASLDKLRQRDDRVYYPAHGAPVTNPKQYVRGLIGHRLQREKQILKLVGEQPRPIPDIVASAYPGLDPRLVTAAGGSVYAHLLDLERRGLVQQDEESWKAA
jgi:glyoxylase-like metal-dependent hydrolase (beta-lactamase superfamily II)